MLRLQVNYIVFKPKRLWYMIECKHVKKHGQSKGLHCFGRKSVRTWHFLNQKYFMRKLKMSITAPSSSHNLITNWCYNCFKHTATQSTLTSWEPQIILHNQQCLSINIGKSVKQTIGSIHSYANSLHIIHMISHWYITIKTPRNCKTMYQKHT